MTKTPDGIEVMEGPQRGRRRRFTAEEKRGLVTEAVAPGSSVSLVARRNGISSSLLFRRRRLMELVHKFRSVCVFLGTKRKAA